jgi:hypothetical protein
MKRYAFFVEGITELLFLEKLLTEIFGQKKIVIDKRQIRGGSKNPISITTISTQGNIVNSSYYILIYDCGGDKSIRSYIQDQRNSLLKSGYSKLFGIRDVFPDFDRSEINDLRNGLNFGLPQKGLPTKFILSIMEIEAWFLAEENHFKNIDQKLTCDYIKNNYLFDPSNYDTEQRDNPASDLDKIYKLVGKSYRKEISIISRTINSIEYDNLYFNVINRVAALKDLITEINLFFN